MAGGLQHPISIHHHIPHRAPPTSAVHDASTSPRCLPCQPHQVCNVRPIMQSFTQPKQPDPTMPRWHAPISIAVLCSCTHVAPHKSNVHYVAPSPTHSRCAHETDSRRCACTVTICIPGQHGGARGVWQLPRDTDVPVWRIISQVFAVPSRHTVGTNATATWQRRCGTICHPTTSCDIAGSHAVGTCADTHADGGG